MGIELLARLSKSAHAATPKWPPRDIRFNLARESARKRLRGELALIRGPECRAKPGEIRTA